MAVSAITRAVSGNWTVHLDIKSLYPHLKVNWNVLMCKILTVIGDHLM